LFQISGGAGGKGGRGRNCIKKENICFGFSQRGCSKYCADDGIGDRAASGPPGYQGASGSSKAPLFLEPKRVWGINVYLGRTSRKGGCHSPKFILFIHLIFKDDYIVSSCRLQQLYGSLQTHFGKVWRESVALVARYNIISTTGSSHFGGQKKKMPTKSSGLCAT